MIQFDDDTEPLLTSKFWVRLVYQELLHAASRFSLSPAAELKRPISNLVKVASHPKVRYQAKANISALRAPISEWIGAECPVDFLNVWFPAHWAPLVFEELQQKEDDYIEQRIPCGLMRPPWLLTLPNCQTSARKG